MNSPYSTAFLKTLPLTAYAYCDPAGVWSIRNNGATVAEATLTEAELIAKANEIANEIDWYRQSRGGDAERDYNGE